MKQIAIFFVYYIYVIISIHSQSLESKHLIRDINWAIKKHSIVTKSIQWQQLKQDLKSISYSGVHQIDKEKIYEVYTAHLRQAGDTHSLFYTVELQTELAKQTLKTEEVSATYLGSNMAYIRVPSCITYDEEKDVLYAENLIRNIQQIDSHRIDKWIIDLRDNRGGNIWPMLAGVSPIIGGGLINHVISAKGVKENYITIGKLAFSNREIISYATHNKYKKLAILLNGRTASSGEMLAISLLGFERTKSFGWPTRGLTTVNKSLTFRDGSQLFLATGYMADKNKRVYKEVVTPDVMLDANMTEDDIIATVIKWLQE